MAGMSPRPGKKDKRKHKKTSEVSSFIVEQPSGFFAGLWNHHPKPAISDRGQQGTAKPDREAASSSTPPSSPRELDKSGKPTSKPQIHTHPRQEPMHNQGSISRLISTIANAVHGSGTESTPRTSAAEDLNSESTKSTDQFHESARVISRGGAPPGEQASSFWDRTIHERGLLEAQNTILEARTAILNAPCVVDDRSQHRDYSFVLKEHDREDEDREAQLEEKLNFPHLNDIDRFTQANVNDDDQSDSTAYSNALGAYDSALVLPNFQRNQTEVDLNELFQQRHQATQAAAESPCDSQFIRSSHGRSTENLCIPEHHHPLRKAHSIRTSRSMDMLSSQIFDDSFAALPPLTQADDADIFVHRSPESEAALVSSSLPDLFPDNSSQSASTPSLASAPTPYTLDPASSYPPSPSAVLRSSTPYMQFDVERASETAYSEVSPDSSGSGRANSGGLANDDSSSSSNSNSTSSSISSGDSSSGSGIFNSNVRYQSRIQRTIRNAIEAEESKYSNSDVDEPVIESFAPADFEELSSASLAPTITLNDRVDGSALVEPLSPGAGRRSPKSGRRRTSLTSSTQSTPPVLEPGSPGRKERRSSRSRSREGKKSALKEGARSPRKGPLMMNSIAKDGTASRSASPSQFSGGESRRSTPDQSSTEGTTDEDEVVAESAGKMNRGESTTTKRQKTTKKHQHHQQPTKQKKKKGNRGQRTLSPFARVDEAQQASSSGEERSTSPASASAGEESKAQQVVGERLAPPMTAAAAAGTGAGAEKDNSSLPTKTLSSIFRLQNDLSESEQEVTDTDWGQGDWNSRFQSLITRYRMTSVGDTQRVHLNQELLNLARDFVHTAKTYGRIIIQERYLQVRSECVSPKPNQFFKTIEPSSGIGGVAGGQKYKIAGILFKFAVDTHGIYSDDRGASKVASLELQGLQAYLNLELPGLHFPLMAIVDFLGFRLIACSLLPISPLTLIYGSGDQGRTIHKEEPEMNAIMRRAAKSLYIRPHLCGRRLGHTRLLSAAADVEGHRGTDSRYYMVDYSRTFPPTTPNPQIRGSNLFQLFRPELLAERKTPLCPDAFSRFIEHDPDRELYEQEIRQATQYLLHDAVDATLEDLNTSCREALDQHRLQQLRISEVVHRHGVNLRYLGLCAERAKDRWTRMVVVLEIVARVIKNELRSELRAEMERIKVPLQTRYHQLVVLFLNVAFYYATQEQRHYRRFSDLSVRFWNEIIPREAKAWFNLKSFDILAPTAVQPKAYEPISFLEEKPPGCPSSLGSLLLRRVSEMCGIQLRDQDLAHVDRGAPFNELLISSLEPTVKHMSIIDNATGNYLYQMAMTTSDSNHSTDLFKEATGWYERALCSNPRDWETLLNSAECWYKLCVFQAGRGVGIAAIVLDSSHQLVSLIEHLYQLAEEASKNNPWVLFKYARFLTRCGASRFQEAELKFLDSLKKDPNNTECLMCYATFLRFDLDNSKAADPFDARCSAIRKLELQAEKGIPATGRPKAQTTAHGQESIRTTAFAHAAILRKAAQIRRQ